MTPATHLFRGAEHELLRDAANAQSIRQVISWTSPFRGMRPAQERDANGTSHVCLSMGCPPSPRCCQEDESQSSSGPSVRARSRFLPPARLPDSLSPRNSCTNAPEAVGRPLPSSSAWGSSSTPSSARRRAFRSREQRRTSRDRQRSRSLPRPPRLPGVRGAATERSSRGRRRDTAAPARGRDPAAAGDRDKFERPRHPADERRIPPRGREGSTRPTPRAEAQDKNRL